MSGQLVYLIQHEYGPVKIGISNDPDGRLSLFQRGCPFELNLRTTIDPINDGSEYQLNGVVFCETLESALQRYYEPTGIRGEWFDVPSGDVKALEDVKTLSAADVLQTTIDFRFGPHDDGTIIDHINNSKELINPVGGGQA